MKCEITMQFEVNFEELNIENIVEFQTYVMRKLLYLDPKPVCNCRDFDCLMAQMCVNYGGQFKLTFSQREAGITGGI